MLKKLQNKHTIKSTRLENYNYSQKPTALHKLLIMDVQIIGKDAQNNKTEMREDIGTQLLTQLSDVKIQSILESIWTSSAGVKALPAGPEISPRPLQPTPRQGVM